MVPIIVKIPCRDCAPEVREALVLARTHNADALSAARSKIVVRRRKKLIVTAITAVASWLSAFLLIGTSFGGCMAGIVIGTIASLYWVYLLNHDDGLSVHDLAIELQLSGPERQALVEGKLH